ncbi:MAG: hypothetical protein I8H78_10485 [Flavobacteriales bacterium]|nr:hypothetical protein [Flavobacteriales bacterium]
MNITLAKEVIKDYTIKIDNLRILDSDEVEEIAFNLKIIHLLNEIQCYFSIVEQNYNEFDSQLKSNTVELIKGSGSPLKPNEEILNKIMINLNRLLLNYLSSYRVLIDHIPRLLNQYQRISLKAFLSEIFDKNFEYRFCDQLRNFAQHKNLPITKFGCEADISLAKVFYLIDIESLLSQDYHWRFETRRDMEKYNDIDSLSLISSHYQIIKEIRSFVFIFFESDFFSASSYLEEIANEFHGDYKIVLLYDNGEVQNIPTSMINQLKKEFV